MFAILDLAIGLVFVFLVFSLVVSAANEIWLTILNSRAELLQEGLRELLHDRGNLAKACDLLAHPLIAALSRGATGKPTYIPRDTFVSAVLDLIAPARPDKPRDIADIRAGIERLGADGGTIKNVENAIKALGAGAEASKEFGKTHAKSLSDLATLLPVLAADSTLANHERILANWNAIPADITLQATLKKLLDALPPTASQTDIQRVRAAIAKPEDEPEFATLLATLLEPGRKEAAQKLVDAGVDRASLNQQANKLITETLTRLAAETPRVNVLFRKIAELANNIFGTKPISDPTALENETLNVLQAALRGLLAQTGLQATLTSMLEDARHDYDAFREKAGTWFDNSMDRVTGWYKSHTQFWLFILGIILAVACNVDSVHIMRNLSADPDKLSKVVASAQAYVDKASAGGNQNQAPAPADSSALAAVNASVDSFKQAFARMNDLSLPIGWGAPVRSYYWEPQSNAEWTKLKATKLNLSDPSQAIGFWDHPEFFFPLLDISHIIGALFGWLTMALAASLGAPFWFDTLNRIMTVRSAGRAPEERDNGEPGKRDQDSKNNSPDRPSGTPAGQ